jgi:hypothetical protein
VQLRIQRADAMQVEPGQLDGRQPSRIHGPLQVRDGRSLEVNAGDDRARNAWDRDRRGSGADEENDNEQD